MHVKNFDVMRVAAALAVLASHAVPLTQGSDANELLFRLTRQQATLGHLAVAVFFVISGYVITESFVRGGWSRFVVGRALRIFPPLAASLVVLAFVAGPLLSTWAVADYFADERPWRYVWGNLVLFGFNARLPGVFDTVAYTSVVNGSLYTLQYEAACYLAVLGLGLVGLLKRWILLALTVLFLVASAKFMGGYWVEFGSYFLGGAMFYVWQPPLRLGWAVSCLVLLVTAALTGGLRLAVATTGAYLIIYIGRGVRPLGSIRTDISYGIYIWAFPVQQCIVQWGRPGMDWTTNIALSLPIVLSLAWLSCHAVERPAQRLKNRLVPNRGGRPTIGSAPLTKTGAALSAR